MIFINKLKEISLNNVAIKRFYTYNYADLINKIPLFRQLYRESLSIYRFYDKKYFTTNDSDNKECGLNDLVSINDGSNDSNSKSLIINRDSTSSLTYSLIQDAFDAVANDYSKNLSNKEFNGDYNEFGLGCKTEFDGMTPAQKFYAKNKDKLLSNAKKIFLENFGKIDTICNLEEPVIRPPKNHVWEYGSVTTSEHREHIVLQKGQIPTINDIIKILEQEHFVDSVAINLDECNRRDIGLYAIISTGKTFSHCRRVGRLLYRIFVDLEIPFVSQVSYARSSRKDQWIIAHLGPLHVYLMTQELREFYKLEELWSPNTNITIDMIESDNEALDSGVSNNIELRESDCDMGNVNVNECKLVTESDIVYEKFKKDDDYG
ncbi:conserved Plasmodium protein, unknown function [Babesia microti strain RI]|uniref:Mitochondrial assembly of ribosomal large subunit protein 1 n=1 Tax=Babesia microti (strain RI) TaxID=1133968 RepID=A0A1N6LXQ9_BABMR|nr:conserved Plasmodium protein, unknown function [Babesia microti strain RI]SIO73669.1 conserved Plasmodium protein, unknown function [Babesia microti strain RI]|eukprot:XP_021337741.1 conserved Plasmodium protein, unknown function [Babesia microti strain RI]